MSSEPFRASKSLGRLAKMLAVVLCLAIVPLAGADGLKVTGIKAVHHDGQTFITWMDVIAGKEDGNYHYTLYRSSQPITQDNLPKAEKRIWDIPNHSSKLFSYWFANYLLVPWGRYCAIENGGTPLPPWSGLAVVTPDKAADSYYAVVATDFEGHILTTIEPGQSATTQPVHETVAPIQPIKMWDSAHPQDTQFGKEFGKISGKQGMPLVLQLHGGGGEFVFGRLGYGDFYLLFGPREMGYREGIQAVFDVDEEDGQLLLCPSSAIMGPRGDGYYSTWWGGYFCLPQWAKQRDTRFYPFTHRELDYMVPWSVKHYDADPNRVYCRGGSIGGNGAWNYGFHRPQLFAAVYPMAAKLTSEGVSKLKIGDTPWGQVEMLNMTMDDGRTDYAEWYDSIHYAAEHHDDLPFAGWSCGRFDAARGWVNFKNNVIMAKTMEANHHGFAWAWDLGGHGGGYETLPSDVINKYYSPDKFALNQSYPAFSNSSIDDDPGNGDAFDGTLVGGINLGFDWKDVVDENGHWAITVSNDLNHADMTVDITPRRCQKFKAKPGETFHWADSTGDSGQVVADQWGLVTIPKVKIAPRQQTRLILATNAADTDAAKSFKSPPAAAPPAISPEYSPVKLQWVRVNFTGRCILFQFQSTGNPQSAWVKNISAMPTILVNGKNDELEPPVYQKLKTGNNGPIGLPYIIYKMKHDVTAEDKVTVSAPADWIECNGGKLGALNNVEVDNYKGKKKRP